MKGEEIFGIIKKKNSKGEFNEILSTISEESFSSLMNLSVHLEKFGNSLEDLQQVKKHLNLQNIILFNFANIYYHLEDYEQTMKYLNDLFSNFSNFHNNFEVTNTNHLLNILKKRKLNEFKKSHQMNQKIQKTNEKEISSKNFNYFDKTIKRFKKIVKMLENIANFRQNEENSKFEFDFINEKLLILSVYFFQFSYLLSPIPFDPSLFSSSSNSALLISSFFLLLFILFYISFYYLFLFIK